MNRRAWWVDAETDDVALEVVAAARQAGPSPAARSRLDALLGTESKPIAPLRTRTSARAISLVTGGTGAAAAALEAVIRKGVSVATKLSVAGWAAVGTLLGLGAFGGVTAARLFTHPETRPEPAFVGTAATEGAPATRTPSAGEEKPAAGPTASQDAPAQPASGAQREILRPKVLERMDRQERKERPERPERQDRQERQATRAALHPGGGPPVSSIPAAGVPPPPVSSRSPARLSAEIGMLDAARAKLQGADALGALAVLSRYREEFPQGALTDEASLVRIRALLATGRRSEARAEADRLLAHGPPGPVVEQVRTLLPR